MREQFALDSGKQRIRAKDMRGFLEPRGIVFVGENIDNRV